MRTFRFDGRLNLYGKIGYLGNGFLMTKSITISGHARKRMAKYELDEDLVIQVVRDPDRLADGYRGRRVAHKFMNDHILRVVYEEDHVITVVTVYPARRERFEKKV